MARRSRLDAPSVAHHVMVRGLDGQCIYRGPDDYQDFVDRLIRLLPACDARCLAWALLPNHAHLVVRTQWGELSRLMRRLNTGYAVRFNKHHARRGYLFQDRFRSRIATGDADLVGLIRYVNRNPLEAGLVASLDHLARFPWSGHGALVGARPALPFEAVAETLSLFGDDPAVAQRELCVWMQRDAEEPASVQAIVSAGSLPLPPAAAFEPPPRIGLDELLSAACARYAVAPDELTGGVKTRRVARARAAVAYVGVVKLGMQGQTIAAALGVGASAVSMAIARGRRQVGEDGFAPFATGSGDPSLPRK